MERLCTPLLTKDLFKEILADVMVGIQSLSESRVLVAPMLGVEYTDGYQSDLVTIVGFVHSACGSAPDLV